MYPNEIELQWSVLIVLYPFLTGLVAGAFILASLERVFRVKAVQPTYRLALLTALSFLLVAPLPLQLHLGHPERSYEMYLTPHKTSAMAMFGFVYLWYLMAVLVLEVWLDYRRDIVVLSQSTTGWRRWLYRLMTLVPAARLRRVYFWLDQGEPVVVVAADAGGVHLLGHGVGDRRRDAPLHVDDVVSRRDGRYALRRHNRDLPVLYLHY